MARIRSIHPDACRSEKLAEVSAQAERTYWRLLTECDDHGRAEDHPKLLAATLFPLVDQATTKAVDGWLEELHDAGLIVRYEHDGRRYLSVNAWDKYQHPQRPKKSEIPGPNDPGSTPRGAVRDMYATHPVHVASGGEGRGGEKEREGNTSVELVLVSNADLDSDPISRIFDAWVVATGRTSRTVLDAKRRKIIGAALKNYPEADLIDAVRGWRHSPHHRGENEQQTVYNDLELLLRGPSHIERFRDLERNGPTSRGPKPKGFAGIEAFLANQGADQ